jgi:sugar phosphate isomerase/epimerase
MIRTARIRQAMAATVGAAAILGSGGAMAAEAACLGLAPDRVGMQLYSVLNAFRPGPPPTSGGPNQSPVDPARLEGVVGQLHGIGWTNIENFGGAWGLGDAGYKAMLARHGMKVVAGHESNEDAGFAASLERAKVLGQTYIGVSQWGRPGLGTLENVLETAAHLNSLGERAAAQGLKFYAHNHQDEFKNKFSYDINGDGRPETVSAWEIVAAKTDPRYVSFEIDVHWARVANGLDKFDDLLAFLQKHRDRIVLLHIKDTAPDGKIADLGRGTTDWRRLLAAAGPQIGYYLWEFDYPPAPMESAAIAYTYLTCGNR